MKPLYWILIGVGVLVLVLVIIKMKKSNKATNTNNNQLNSQENNNSLQPGGSSQVSQIINSLFPYYNSTLSQINSKDDRSEMLPR